MSRHAVRALWHVQREGVDDVFRPPLFHGAIETRLLADKDYRKSVLSDVKRFLHSPKIQSVSSVIRFNIPKSRYAYRAASWIELTDAVKYLALVLTEFPRIEAARLPLSAQTIMSYRFKPYGLIFDKRFNYASFRERSAEISKSGNFAIKVNTDIANFYDRVNLHRLESVLPSIGCDPANIAKINDLLMIWAGRNSYGLPVGSDASRILAEASLINVDNELVRRGITFTRFVDDYRLFATNFMEANRNLNYLIDALDAEGLFLNTSKTAMIDLKARLENVEEPPGGPGEEQVAEFEPIDTVTKVERVVRIAGRYTSRIVKSYRCPGEDQIKIYQKMNLAELKLSIDKDIDVSEDNIRNYIKAFIYQAGEKSVPDLCEIISKHIHYVPYIVDALIKERVRLSGTERVKLRDFFASMLNGDQCTEYYKIAAFRICSEPDFNGLEICRKYIEGMPIALNPISQREIVLRMAELGDRPALVMLRQKYGHFSLTARRAIFYCWKITERVLPAEKRAFMKTLHKTETDRLIVREAGKMLG